MPHTILSVDHDGAVRRARNEILREAGFEVIEAAGGADALKLASDKQPALVVLAVELPDIDGFAVCKRLKADNRTASIPVLHISGRGGFHRDYPKSLESGANACLPETVEAPVLDAVVTALMARKTDGLAKERLEALIASIPDEVWFADTQHKFTLANPSVPRGFNIGASAVVDVEDLARGLEVFRADGSPRPVEEAPPLRALRGETVRNLEEIVRTPAGAELRYRQVSASPVRDAAGDIVGSVSVVRDITEHKRAEQALRASEERYRTLFVTMTEGFALCEIICDEAGKPRDFRYLAVNPAFERQTGLKAEDILGRTVLDAFPEAEPVWIERYGKVALTGEPARFEAWFGPLGRWFEVSVFQTEPSRFGVVFTDITERKRAGEDLRQSEERYRMLFNTLIEGFCIIEVIFDADLRPVDFRFLEINPAFERQTGLKNARGRLMRELAPDHEAHWFEIYGQVALTGQPARFVNEARALNRWYEVSAYRVGGPESRKVAILFNDITARKRAEEALADAIQRLNAHMDNSPLAVVEFDSQFRVTRWSKEAHRVFGWSAEEILGRAIAEMRWVHEDDVEAVRQVSQDMLDRRRPRNLHVNRNYRKDGSVIECEWYNSAIYDTEGKLTSILSQVLDVTDRKRSEVRLREAQKLESLGLLAGGVAHDFNNLLVGVIGNASLAQDILPPGHPAAELLDGVIKTGEQAAHLTRQMLAYSGKGKFLVEPLNLSALIPEMSGLVRPSMSKKTSLHLDLDPDLPPVEADRGQVQQVFMNLALNAAEAIGGHEGLIAVRTGVENVDARYVRQHPEAAEIQPGSYVCLEVSDNGCGMDEATRARIFDPFFSTKFTGRGLGLAAVAGIMRGHKGAITVDSAPGKGSCFTVLFPAAEGATGERPAAARVAALQGAGVVLVVDDEQIVREMAKKGLERSGYTVLLADSGLAARDILRRHPGDIALVVLDLSMPGMSGEEVLPELRKIRPAVKVVVSSGYSEAETMALFKGQQVSGFIQKPYTFKELAEKVKGCLG